MKLRFLCVGVWVENVKHEPPKGSEGMLPQKIFKNIYSKIKSGAY